MYVNTEDTIAAEMELKHNQRNDYRVQFNRQSYFNSISAVQYVAQIFSIG